MNKAIVTTTINSPTEAIHSFLSIAKAHGWMLFVVGDQRTPHDEFVRLERANPSEMVYLSPAVQAEKYAELSDILGWNTIQRRNIGFIEAYLFGADIIATVDDDNIPNATWGVEVSVGKVVTADCWHTELAVFDPLSVTEYPHLWHRGFPIQLIAGKNEVINRGPVSRRVYVQADLWDGDPDVDAIARIAFRPDVVFKTGKFFSNRISPFNSQNTFLARDIFPWYFLFPFIGRMDDIWASYVIQLHFPDCVLYSGASVYQARNAHDLSRDLQDELIGYTKSLELVNNLAEYERFLPARSLEAYELYKQCFQS